MQAIRRFGRSAAGRAAPGSHRAAGCARRGAHHAPGHGPRAPGRAHCGAPRARGQASMGYDPWLVAGPSAPMMHGTATAPALPTGSPPPPPPPLAAWIPPSTPTPEAVAAGLSLRPPGYAPVSMRSTVNAEEALAFISAPSGASGVVHLGVGMEGAAAAGTP
uniref:Uncharacterized protein n=1 Tax=Triticum urartu TaxID=4572 RepID=A0A8R7Q299_TRIUA